MPDVLFKKLSDHECLKQAQDYRDSQEAPYGATIAFTNSLSIKSMKSMVRNNPGSKFKLFTGQHGRRLVIIKSKETVQKEIDRLQKQIDKLKSLVGQTTIEQLENGFCSYKATNWCTQQ